LRRRVVEAEVEGTERRKENEMVCRRSKRQKGHYETVYEEMATMEGLEHVIFWGRE
jgi:hypothetical protein